MRRPDLIQAYYAQVPGIKDEHRPAVLALDLGTSSIGWALFELGENKLPVALIDLGVRHFDEVIEPKSKVLKNATRRSARQARKNIQRRRRRRSTLLAALQKAGLVPDGTTPFSDSEDSPHKPYEIRSRAAVERVELRELGRALYHLGRRRGFKSNRGARLSNLQSDPEIAALLVSQPSDNEATTDEAKEEGKVLTSIASLRDELGELTLGQFFWDEIRRGGTVRGRHTDRAMYEAEFETIWREQSRHYPSALTPELKSVIGHALFHQRPLKTQKFLKAKCSLEPNKVCAERAQLVAQRFRYWQDLCNMELTDNTTGEKRPLSLAERGSIADKLDGVAELSWNQLRTELGLSKSWMWNLARAKDDKLKGNLTAARVRRRAPELWDSLDEKGQEEIVEHLLTIGDRGVLYGRLRKSYDLPAEAAYRLAVMELEAGTANLSSKAMRRMLSLMRSGLSRREAQTACGYEPWSEEVVPVSRIDSLPSRTEIPNPRVRKALGQVRRVVNAISATYGRPSVIRIELAREMSLTAKERLDLEKTNKLRERDNKEADEWLEKQGDLRPTREKRFWFRLAKQCGWVCPYSGRAIEQSLVSMSLFQIEHIVPYVLSLDDSFNNLTVCEAEMNRRKGARTPFQAFGQTGDWEKMSARIDRLTGLGSRRKKILFKREETAEVDSMVSRQLNETKWICKAAARFVRPVCDEVEVTKGSATAMLRQHWGLMEALYGVNEKRRDDLRHHAVDAVAIAFISRSLFQKISRTRSEAAAATGLALKVTPLSDQTVPNCPSWLHASVKERLRTVVISHETQRAIKSAFHKDTAYGKRGEGLYQVRKPLESMTDGELNLIVDDRLRQLAMQAYAEAGRDSAKAFGGGLLVGRRIVRKSRITEKIPKAPMLALPSGAPTKYFKLGNNHHVEIFEELTSGKRRARYVTSLAAADRVRNQGASLVNTTPPAPGWSFVMWLSPGDTIRVPDDDREFFHLESIWSTTNQLCFRALTAAAASNNEDRLLKSIGTLNATKLEVDAIGRVREVREGTV
jgi:CRISPR-associated endonuclease Csn1